MTTIKDVARQAGVSISTVSHVLNGTRFVSEVTCRKVNEAVQDFNYKPSAVARSLKTSKTYIIGMLTSTTTNPFFAEVIHGVEMACYQRGYHLVLCNADGNLEKQASYLKNLEAMQIDGLLVMATQNDAALFDSLRDYCPWPLVILDGQAPCLEADVVMEDAEQGGYEATCYLIDHGHESIACISGPMHLSPSRKRLTGYYRALEERGIPKEKSLVVEGQLTAESGFDTASQLLDSTPGGSALPAAWFVGNDLMAIGAIACLRARGYRVPEDISIMGYDDIELSAYTLPPLTTFNQPKRELGRLAADALISRINNPGAPYQLLMLQSTLVTRQSVKSV